MAKARSLRKNASFILIVLIILGLRFLICFPALAEMRTVSLSSKLDPHSEFEPFEVASAVSRKGVLLLGWMEANATNDGAKGRRKSAATIPEHSHCAFSTSSNGGESWGPKVTRLRPSLWVSLNPAVASDEQGGLYALCMSIDNHYSSGVLEISYSSDQGATWGPWFEVAHVENGIPDKPALVAIGDTLWVGYSKTTRAQYRTGSCFVGDVILKVSTDKGQTWKEVAFEQTPVLAPHSGHHSGAASGCASVSGLPPAASSGSSSSSAQSDSEVSGRMSGDQGLSLAKTQSGELFRAWGEYSGDIWFAASKRGARSLGTPSRVSASHVEIPVTQLLVDEERGRLALLWYDAHKMGRVFVALGEIRDGGNGNSKSKPLWRDPVSISDQGGLASGQIDAHGILHLVWKEKQGGQFTTQYARLQFFESGKAPVWNPKRTLNPHPETSEPPYIGAYQSLVYHPKAREDGRGIFHMFWISWEKGSRLFHTYWEEGSHSIGSATH